MDIFSFKIKGKLLFTSITIIFLLFLVTTLIFIYSIYIMSNNDIKVFKQNELENKKKALNEHTEILFDVLNNLYEKDAQNNTDIEKTKDQLITIIKNAKYDNNVGYFWINDITRPIPSMIMHPTDPTLNGKVLDDPKYNCAYGEKVNLFKAFVDVCLKDGSGYVDYLWAKPTKDGLTEDQPKISFVKLFEPFSWIIGTGLYIDDIDKAVLKRSTETKQFIINVLIKILSVFVFLIILSILIMIIFSNNMSNKLFKVTDLAEKIAEGKLDLDKIDLKSRDELGILIASFNKMLYSLNDALNQVDSAASQVSAGSSQIAQSSQSLSQGATEQASSLEEMTSLLTEISSQIKLNSENASQASGLSKQAMENADNGNKQMQELVLAMSEINKSSDEVKRIVKVIDDIAFQTNLLALNANVEAARAGKYGKGFTVVAEEVRNLASRSAESVQETTVMVEQSMKNIENGNILVKTTSKQLEEILNSTSKVSELVGEIATASKEQTHNLEQINQGLDQVDQITQSNTANAEETASASEELASQAQQLKGIISRFKLKKEGTLKIPQEIIKDSRRITQISSN
jgi:methyl-accepting chemotaxis protein